MRLWKMAVMLLAAMVFVSCGQGRTQEIDPDRLMPMKIGVLEYNAEYHYTPKEARLVYLKPGEPVTVRMNCYYEEMDTVNINILFEYEGGACTVTSENEDIQISRGNNAILFYKEHFYKWEERTFTFEETIDNTGWLAINPLGSERGHLNLYSNELVSTEAILSDMPHGREYYLTVSADDFADSKHAADAVLKIVQLPDAAGKKSDRFTIELVEYELSDTYKMMLE